MRAQTSYDQGQSRCLTFDNNYSANAFTVRYPRGKSALYLSHRIILSVPILGRDFIHSLLLVRLLAGVRRVSACLYLGHRLGLNPRINRAVGYLQLLRRDTVLCCIIISGFVRMSQHGRHAPHGCRAAEMFSPTTSSGKLAPNHLLGNAQPQIYPL